MTDGKIQYPNEQLTNHLDHLREYLLSRLDHGIDWERHYDRIGILTLHKLPNFSPSAFVQLLMKKNAAYGGAPIRRWDHIGLIIRIDSKWQRVLNLETHSTLPPDQHDEALEDTLTDILGYCVLGLALCEEKKEVHR